MTVDREGLVYAEGGRVENPRPFNRDSPKHGLKLLRGDQTFVLVSLVTGVNLVHVRPTLG